MKLHFTKWLGLAATSILMLAGMNSCVKNRAGETDFSNLQDFVVFQAGGLVNFAGSTISAGGADPDTVTVTTVIALASKNVASQDITVHIALDDSKRTDYNAANAASGANYLAFLIAFYKLLTPTVVIPKGQSYAIVSLEVYARKVPDPSTSYMLPLIIVDASGKNLSTNLNTNYFHIIGNPLAGIYSWDYHRYNTADTTGVPSGFNGATVAASPSSATTLVLPDSYIRTFVDGSEGTSLSFTNTAGVLSNFSLAFSANLVKELGAGSFTIAVPPVLVTAVIVGNANTKYVGSTFRTYFSLINSSGGTRTLIDNFVKIQ